VLQPLRRHHAVGVWLIIALTAAVALSACGGTSTPGVLTQSDMPNYLGLKANPSAAATATRLETPSGPHCNKAGVAVFTVPGWRVPKRGNILDARGSGFSPIVISISFSCATSSDAHRAFKSGASFAGRPIAGIGDEATLLDLSAGQRSYALGSRKGNQFSAVFVFGPTKNKRITPALVELLARRAAARS
jgi:hypothetical protein